MWWRCYKPTVFLDKSAKYHYKGFTLINTLMHWFSFDLFGSFDNQIFLFLTICLLWHCSLHTDRFFSSNVLSYSLWVYILILVILPSMGQLSPCSMSLSVLIKRLLIRYQARRLAPRLLRESFVESQCPFSWALSNLSGSRATIGTRISANRSMEAFVLAGERSKLPCVV